MWVLIGVVVFGIVLAIAWFVRQFAGSPPKTVRHGVTADGTRLSFRADADTSKNRNIGYRIGITALAGFSFTLRREVAFDRFGKSLGVAAEQQTGDADFDATFFIDSNDQRIGRALRHSPEARAAAEAVRAMADAFGGKFERIRAAGGQFWLTVTGSAPLPSDDDLVRIAEALKTIADAVSVRMADPSGGVPRDPFRRRAIAVVTLSSGLLVFGILGLLRMPAARLDLDAGHLWWWSSIIGLMATLAIGLVVMRWLHASSRAHWVLLEWLTIGLGGMILSLHAFAIEVNRDFDREPASVIGPFEARVTREEYRCGKRRRRTCTRYEFHPPADAIPGVHDALRIDSMTYYRLQRSAWFTVRIRPGLLGCRWIESIDEARPPDPAAGPE